MTMNLVRSLGAGSCLKWGSVNANGAAGGTLLFWDFRVLRVVGFGSAGLGTVKKILCGCL